MNRKCFAKIKGFLQPLQGSTTKVATFLEHFKLAAPLSPARNM
jgi:hypothetical protein